MKYEEPKIELIELKLRDVMEDSNDGLINWGEGDGESGEFGDL